MNSLRVRRVVTGHDSRGKAVVSIDDVADNVSSRRPGQEGCVIWATDSAPANNLDPGDGAEKPVGTVMPNGTVFRIVRYAPGVAPRVHRSFSIDYGVVLAGSITLELEDRAEVTLRAGDVLVQRGTIHNWTNRGERSCVIAFVLIDALPVEVNGHKLESLG